MPKKKENQATGNSKDLSTTKEKRAMSVKGKWPVGKRTTESSPLGRPVCVVGDGGGRGGSAGGGEGV